MVEDQGRLDDAIGLAFETSTAVGSVALGRGGDVLRSHRLSGPRTHAVEFIPTVARLCEERGVSPREVQWVFVSSGPGSFTGLRIGATTARILGMATSARIVEVPTLEIIVQNALEEAPPPPCLAVILDAKRGRVYAATFALSEGRYQSTSDPVEADPHGFLSDCVARGSACAVVGEGVLYHQSVVSSSGLRVLPESLYPPRAETVYRLGYLRACAGQWTDRRDLTPTYIRPPEAEEKWAQRHGTDTA